MHIRCPRCDETFELPALPEGSPVKCRHCKKIFASHPLLEVQPRAPRIPAPLSCTAGGYSAQMVDISKSGILVTMVGFDGAPGQDVEVRLHLPGSHEPLCIYTQIVRLASQDKSHWALKIVRVNDTTRFQRFLRIRENTARIVSQVKGPGGKAH